MLDLADWSRSALMNVVVLDGTDGFDTLKRGFGGSQCLEAAHGIKQFLQS